MIVGIPIIQLIAVRLRDQLRSEAPADGGARSPTAASSRAASWPALREQRLLRVRRRGGRTRRRRERALATRRGAVRRRRSRRISRARLVRGERPALLVEADATDPAATGNAIAALNQLAQSALRARPDGAARVARGAARRRSTCACIARYNPEAITQYNIVPGLMGVILTMTMVMMTGLAITRERERGTMENLLATPATAARGDDRQDRALRRDRPDPGDDHPARGAAICSTCRCVGSLGAAVSSPCCSSSPPT